MICKSPNQWTILKIVIKMDNSYCGYSEGTLEVMMKGNVLQTMK